MLRTVRHRVSVTLARLRIGPIGVIALTGIAMVGPFAGAAVADSWRAPVVTAVAAHVTAGGPQPGQPILLGDDVARLRCTLGLPWRLPSTSAAWVTAGHCREQGNQVIPGDGAPLRGVSPAGSNGPVDAGIVVVDEEASHQWTVAGVPVVDVRDARIGDTACLSGSTTGTSCGWEVAAEPGEYPVGGRPVRGALLRGRGGPCASPGDSGGPVFTLEADGAVLVGVVAASSDMAGIPGILPESCRVVFTTVTQLSAMFGGEPRLQPR